jgi:Lrp/AsnC family transcriptional regulator, leucine-responsive regulatory protein
MHKLKDAAARPGYRVVVDSSDFGFGIAAHVRFRAMPGEVKRTAQMLIDTPEVVEADRVTEEDSFMTKLSVSDVQELESVIDRFQSLAATDIAIIQPSTVAPRLPKC